MFFAILVTFASIYSLLAVVILITSVYLKKVYGLTGLNQRVNKLAKTKSVAIFEVYSWISIAIWLALALPWIDLFTANLFSSFKDDGINTYFGWMSSKQAEVYFALMFMNILGVKAALKFTEISPMLRRGHVHLVRHVWGALVWIPIEE